jgi:hypothetical protein
MMVLISILGRTPARGDVMSAYQGTKERCSGHLGGHVRVHQQAADELIDGYSATYQRGDFRIVYVSGNRPILDTINGFINHEQREKEPFAWGHTDKTTPLPLGSS